MARPQFSSPSILLSRAPARSGPSHLAIAIATATLLALSALQTKPPGWKLEHIRSLESSGDARLPSEPFLEGSVVAPMAELPENLSSRGSWLGSDAFTGEWVSGWFAAPSRVRVMVAGYPHLPGNMLSLEWRDSEGQISIQPFNGPNPRESWRPWDLKRPAGAVAFRFRAVDGTTEIFGWLGLTEPVVPPAWSLLASPTARASLALAAQALLLTTLGAALLQTFALWRVLPPQLHALAAFAGVALLGWMNFWTYFAHPLAGKIFSWTLCAAACLALFRKESDSDGNAGETGRIIGLTALIGVFFMALLLTFEPVHLSHAAANRFNPGLPSDNEIPRMFSERLWAGQPPRNITGDWLSSDRPPLQSGWVLLTWPVLNRLGFEADVIALTGGVWFQLGWVLAVVALLRHQGLSLGHACACVTALAFSGLLLLFSVYVWPKLGAASLVLGAWLFWQNGSPFARTLAGVCAGLGWVAHGGVAFSLLALVPVVLFRQPRPAWRHLLATSLTFVVIAIPWTCYQKFYEPPGNRLLKWHLAGAIAPDERTFPEALRENYAAQGADAALSARLINLRLQFSGDWTTLLTFGGLAPGPAVRAEETTYTFRALAWWTLAIMAWPFLLVRARQRGISLAGYGQLLGWAAATLVVWIALMFVPHSAIIHQGSLVTQLLLFSLLTAGALQLNRWFFRLLAGVQLVWFAFVWTPRSPTTEGGLVPGAVGVGVVAGLALLAVIWRGSARQETACMTPESLPESAA